MENTFCILCKSEEYNKFIELSDYRFDRMDYHISLVKCSHCGLVFQNPRPTLAEMQAYYPPTYEPFISKDGMKSTLFIKKKFYQYGINKRYRFIANYKKRGRLLEIGCGSGEFLNAMAQKTGWVTHGIEINETAAKNARLNYGLDVLTGTLDEANFQSSYFDAIALWDVLEHFHNPESTLQEIHRILKPDGLIVLRVPNLDSVDAIVFGKYWAGLDAPRHLYVFNKKTLIQILLQTGFKVQRMSCEFGSHASFLLSVQFWLTEIGINPNLKKKILSLLDNPLTKLIMSVYFIAIGFTLWGPEITLVAIKQDV